MAVKSYKPAFPSAHFPANLFTIHDLDGTGDLVWEGNN